MKTQNLILLIALAFCMPMFVASAQEPDDKVFPESGAIWSVYVLSDKPTLHFIYGLTGDTILNEKRYSKMYLLNDSTLTIGEEDIYVGGIRQEKKVVYMQPATNLYGYTLDEYIMYDFSKGEGETVTFGRNYTALNDIIPTFEFTDFIEIHRNRKIKKEEYTENGRELVIHSTEKWIENVGNASGHFFPGLDIFMNGSDIYYGGILGCMKLDDKIKYLDKRFCDSCFGQLMHDPNLSVDTSVTLPVTVSYNKGSKTIRLKSEAFPVVLRLVSLQGTEILKKKIEYTDEDIDASIFTTGIYFYEIIADNLSAKGKLFIN